VKLNVELKCACGNTARYIDDQGEFTCGICPIKNGRDSIRISDVPQLLGWARITVAYLRGQNAHTPAGDSIQATLGQRPAVKCDDPSCDRKCQCHVRGWGGHNESSCPHLRVS
jgi:hypothetical protein